MNPHPPIQDFFTLPTLNLMVFLTFLMQVCTIFINAQHINKQYDGVRALFLSSLALMLHYLLLLLSISGVINLSAPWTQGIREVFNIIGHALIYVAVCQFIGISFNRYLLYGLVPLVVLVGFIPGPPIVRPLVLSIIAILDLVSFWTLLQVKNEAYLKGAHLTAFPLAFYAIVIVIRIVLPNNPPTPGSGPSIPAIFESLSLFGASFLWISAFIFMISQRLQSDLSELAMKDALTRVRNRRAMQGLLNFEMVRREQNVQDFSIILLDIDYFKRINDTYGHDVGDLALQWIAQTMQSAVRIQDVVSRWGGEEFLVLLPGTRLDEVAERLRQTIVESTVPNPSHPLKITFSGGVACSRGHTSVDEICKVADQALYRAKQTRNCVLPELPHESDADDVEI